MLEARRPEQSSTEVCVIPENPQCGPVPEVLTARLDPGGSLLGCLELRGRLVVWDPADREAPPAEEDGAYTDFSWEEEEEWKDVKEVKEEEASGCSRLLAVGPHGDLKLLQVEARRPNVSLLCVCQCPAERLLQAVAARDHGVTELQSLRLLSFAAGRCCLLLNRGWLLQLQWPQAAEQQVETEEQVEELTEEQTQPEERLQTEPQMVSCCRLQLTDDVADVCVCRETMFTLSCSGLVSVHGVSDGVRLATVDLPAYLSSGPAEDDFTSFSSSFCLLQVSADLSTAVAVTRSHAAVAVDLDDYFRRRPDHLLCAAPPAPPPHRPQHPADQDSLSSSSCSIAALGANFSPNRSWEARLASLYNSSQQSACSSSSSSSSSPSSWPSALPHPPASSTRSRAPRGGSTVVFSAPESSAPSLLTVTDFSAQLTFVSPGNRQTTVALWDLESGRASCHRTEGEAAPVQRCGERHHRLLLKKGGVFLVLFSVSQQDLLSRLMLFGSAATVDNVCHLNSWGRCSIPIHTLQAGLKNRQLDTVDFYLKSKENILNPAADQSTASTHSLSEGVQQLCPALDLLCSAVRDSNSEAQSRPFSEQLLNVTLSFIHRLVSSVLTHTHTHGEDAGVRRCVDVLDGYVSELRRYMKRFPWSGGGDPCSPEGGGPEDEWEQLQMQEVVRQAVLTNQMPRAQAVLRGRSLPEQHLSALRTEGLRQVFVCLQRRDLQTASTLLANMGFSVKQQLHSICLYTADRDLREFVVEQLSQRRCFPEQEEQSVAFLKEMERLGSLPASRCPPPAPPALRAAQVGRREAGGAGEEALQQLGGRGGAEGDGGVWTSVRLDWVRNWDQSCQTAVLLSRLQHTELPSCDPAVLWRYLTSLHDQRRVVAWIEAAGAPRWPELRPQLVDGHTACSTYLREHVLDLLARRGLFVLEELADLEQLLWRLAQGGGVMASPPPLPQHRSPLGSDLHSLFIGRCLERSLQYLLYTYLEHYRLTPRNCPLLTNQSLPGIQPWFEMLVKIQEITRDLSDPALLFQASLTCAQVLLPGSQASLSSLLLEGHSLLGLGAVMLAPGGVDQVVLQAERSGRSEQTLDPQLLKMALAPHPKLRAALFPPSSPSSDISVYHLLQALPPLDPSRLFGWQAANTLNSSESSELPHFSSPHLVHRFALVEHLDFLYYLRHGRPSSAFATFLVQQLSGCSDVPLLLQHTWLQVYRLALQCFSVPSVAAAAVCFSELLGVCSLKLRVDIRAMNSILLHLSSSTHLHSLVSKGVKLAEAEPGAAEELIGCLEAAVADSLEEKGVSRSSYEASLEWSLPVQFCQLHGLPLSSVYPAHCAADGQFIHFLLFVQLHNFPPQQVRALAAQFGPALQAHLSLAFQDLQACSPRGGGGGGSGGRPRTLSSEEAPPRPEPPRELFRVLLQSQQEAAPCRYLLQEALEQRCPPLAVLAACPQGAELLPCLCVWVLTSVDDVTAGEATSHLADAPQHHEWTLHDLSVIWRTLLGRGHARPLLRGFQLFQKDCPLVLVLSMFELCCDYRNFSEAKTKLLDFQRTLIALRGGGAPPPGGLPLPWVESQASVLLLVMLQRCSSQFDLHRLLQLLAGVDKLLKSNGPDFRRLSQLSRLLQGSGVAVPPRLLQGSSPSEQQEELQAAVDALQAAGRYSAARQVALLAGLPLHPLLLSQLLQEVNSQKSKRQWRRLETRVCFWRRCHEQLAADGTDPESASRFFLSEAEAGPAAAAAELVGVQERCLLLCLAAHWLSRLSPAPLDQLESLEKKLWEGRVQQRLLAVAMEKESVFSLPPPAVTPKTSPYEALMREFSFANISALNTERSVSLEGLPGGAGGAELPGGPAEEQRGVLAALVGQLLDEGSVHEAGRVCRYFSLHHPDMWVVLRCRGLASGELPPQQEAQEQQEQQEEEEVQQEAPPKRSVTTSPSLGSLSSFVILPLPEDKVAVQLQKLVDQCRHGNNYCKQVLGLYQLSKELQLSFAQMCREDPRSVLEQLLLSEQPERFRKAQAFIRAQGLSADAVAELLSSAVVRALLASTQELQPADRQVYRPSEGRDSLVQLIKLCDDPNLVGVKLVESLSSVPLRDLSCIVELLIVAHDCFSLTCNMEGIVRVLQAARHLSHAHLAPGEQYSLLVRLLTGIGRYNEMTYVFDLLHQNHRFEMLLRKKVETDRGQGSSSLQAALLDYIKRFLPADSEKHNMVALCFSMRREIGENHEIAATTLLRMIQSRAWVTPDLLSSLLKVLGLLKDAAESFSKDSCVRQATRCVRMAKLVSLQLHFLNRGSDLRVVNLQPSELLDAVTALPRCYQVLVVAEAYGYSPDWAAVLFHKVILNGDFGYLEELRRHRPLTCSLFEEIFKKLDGAPSSVGANVKRLLTYCDDVYGRYRLAYQHNLYDVTKTLLQDAKTSSYLSDRLAS